MKSLLSLLAATLSGIALAAASADARVAPEDLAPSDRAGVRAAYDAARHAAHRQENGHLVMRNPGQQWHAEFDVKGFTVTPDHGAWTWGLDLTGYGTRTLPSEVSPSQLHHAGGRIACQRDENLTEWFVNDSRGLEQGWDIRHRPDRADPTAPLQLHLSIRGNTCPLVSTDGASVSFQQEGGGNVLTYGGLKAWDAVGTKLPVRFEQAGEDGIRIAVNDLGARYPITIDPIAQQAYLKPGNLQERSFFGSSVAISGDTVIVGAPLEDSAATGVNGDQTSNGAPESGAAYIFVRSGTAWIQQAYLKASNTGEGDGFGSSVAISGDTVVVTARYEDSAATGVNGDQTSNGAPESGAIYVFTREGTVWTQQAYLKASNTAADDLFGDGVALSGDTLAVGATYEDSAATGVNGNQADNSAPGSGAAYIFTRSGTVWTQQAYLKASNAEGSAPGEIWVGDCFGSSVAISGDTVIVGAHFERSAATGVNGDQTNNAALGAGAAYVFVRSGTAWTQQAYLKASNAEEGDGFGSSVTIAGDTAAVAAGYEDSSATGVNGNQTDNGAPASGAAYIFTRSGTTWTQQAYLKASNTITNGNFGSALASSTDAVVIGAAPHSSFAGQAYVFTRSGTAWTQQSNLKASNSSQSDSYGRCVAISGDIAVVGASTQTTVSDTGAVVPQAGAAYIINLNLEAAPPELAIQQGGTRLVHGATRSFGTVAVGEASDISLTVLNLGQADLALTGNPKVAITGSSDFMVTQEPGSPIAGPGGSTIFKVRLAPASGGAKSGLLSISSNDENNTPFAIKLVGTGVSFTTDTDGDGLSDALESKMTALNFNWEVKQTAMANAYLASVNRSGLYVPAQVHTLRARPTLVTKDTASGRVKLTTHWEKSANLVDYFHLPIPAGSSVSISPSDGIEFEFAAPDNAAFLKASQD